MIIPPIGKTNLYTAPSINTPSVHWMSVRVSNPGKVIGNTTVSRTSLVTSEPIATWVPLTLLPGVKMAWTWNYSMPCPGEIANAMEVYKH